MYVMEKILGILLVDAEYLRENYTLKQCSMYRNYIKKVIFNLRAANTSYINILETKKYKMYEQANWKMVFRVLFSHSNIFVMLLIVSYIVLGTFFWGYIGVLITMAGTEIEEGFRKYTGAWFKREFLREYWWV